MARCKDRVENGVGAGPEFRTGPRRGPSMRTALGDAPFRSVIGFPR